MNVQERILNIPRIMEVNTRIKFLRDEINRHNYDYYVLNFSSVTDDDYDALYRELVELERKHPFLVDSTSPTQRVGAKSANPGFKKVKHTDKKMLSLDNMKSAKDVIDYLGVDEVVMEPKIDGASLKLIYQRGKLVQAITRGNGTEGDDVTFNARTILSVPLKLEAPIDINVVGEVYMTFTVFNELNTKLDFEGQELMANPRNAAAGAIKLLDPKETAARKLRFVAYGSTTEFSNIGTHSKLIEHLEGLGFQSVFMLPTHGTQAVADRFTIENAESLAQRIAKADVHRKALDLPTDGLVFKLNDLNKQRELGEGTKYPKYACAFKFPPERKETILRAVTIQVGRTGKVTPVAELEPVLLSGTTVRRASLCNQDEINRLNVDIGDTVLVEKSAEIIPKVVGVAKKAKASVYILPETCPCCGNKLERPSGMVDSFCPNQDCDDQVLERLLHGCGKSALDIDGCGEVLVRELMNNGVRKLSDVFKVNPSFLKTAARKRFEKGRIAAPSQSFWRKLHALGIDGFGQTLCQEVAARWPSLAKAFEAVEKIKGGVEVYLLQRLVGAVVFQNIADYCDKYADEIDALDSLIGMTNTEQVTGPLSGKSFCITGDLVSGSRHEVSGRIEKAGGAVKSSMTRRVNFLIQGTETGRVKREKAEKLGVPVITETKLYEMMEQEMPIPKNTEEREY